MGDAALIAILVKMFIFLARKGQISLEGIMLVSATLPPSQNFFGFFMALPV